MVYQEAGRQNVAVRDVALKFRQIAQAQNVIVVLSDGEFGVDDVLVLTIESVIEPDFSFLDRAGKRETRQKLIEAPSVLILRRRNEIRRPEAKVIVADPRIQRQQTCRTFTRFGGFA